MDEFLQRLKKVARIMLAATYGFQSRKSSQEANGISNLKDQFKNILDNKNTTGVETEGSEKSFPYWDLFFRAYPDREKFNRTNAVDPYLLSKQSINKKASSSSDPHTMRSDAGANKSTIDEERLKPRGVSTPIYRV